MNLRFILKALSVGLFMKSIVGPLCALESAVIENSVSSDATSAVLKRIIQHENGSLNTISFERGIYHFYPEKGYELYLHISNHDDLLTRTAFPLIDVDHLVIDGNGSTFVFHGRMVPFVIRNSSNIMIKNVSIDWATPFHSEGLVVAQNVEDHTYDLQFSDEYPFEIRNGELVFIKEYYEHSVGQSYLFDPKKREVAHQTQKYSTWWTIRQNTTQVFGDSIEYPYSYSVDQYDPQFTRIGKELKSRFELVKPGIVRVYNHTKKLPPVGFVMVMKGEKGENRTAPAFHVLDSKALSFDSVDVLHAGGMGLIAEGCEDVSLHQFNVIPLENRLVSATADATHFVGCRGKIEMIDCTFSNQLDDGTNIHGCYQEVVEVLNEHQLGVRIGHFQQQGHLLGRAGDRVGLVRNQGTVFPYHALTLRDVRKVNGRYMVLTFDETIPNHVKQGDLLENLDGYPEVLISNCRFIGNRAHGILLASSKKSVVEDCFFHTDMGAILFPAHSSHWYESGVAQDVVIRRNTFDQCGYGGEGHSVIDFNAEQNHHEITYERIEISSNQFMKFEDSSVLSVSKVRGLLFSENSISHSNAASTRYPVFKVFESENISFEENQYDGSNLNLIETDRSDIQIH